MRRRLVERRDAARRSHHERLREARPRDSLAQRAKIARDDGTEIGVDRRRRRPLVLAKLRRDLVRSDDARFRQPAPQLLRDRTLVISITKRKQQADRDCFGLERHVTAVTASIDFHDLNPEHCRIVILRLRG